MATRSKFLISLISHLICDGKICILFLLLFGCKKEPIVDENKLSLLAIYPLEIHETSGLSAFVGNNRFLTVSDTTGKVYVISGDGKLEKTLPFLTSNPEGVCYDPDSALIYLVDEKENDVICIDTLGNEKTRFHVAVDRIFIKHGLEGISLDRKANRLFVINEQFPGRLYQLDFEGIKTDSTDLTFAEDYSGLYFDEVLDQLWILSDQSKTVNQCTAKGVLIKSWETGVKDGEGLLVNTAEKKIFIVTDPQSAIYFFSY